jgi:predicted choloylglycine hydrolase
MFIIVIIISVAVLFYFKKNKKAKLITPDNPIRKMVHSVLEKEFRKEPVTVGDYLDSEYFISFYEKNKSRVKINDRFKTLIIEDFKEYKKLKSQSIDNYGNQEEAFMNICRAIITNKYPKDLNHLPIYFKSPKFVYLHQNNSKMKSITDEFEDLLLRNYEAFKRDGI